MTTILDEIKKVVKKPTRDELDSINRDGYEAGKRFHMDLMPREDNPHDWDDEERHKAWQDGHNQAGEDS